MGVHLHGGDERHALLHRQYDLQAVGVFHARLSADRIKWHFTVDFHPRANGRGEEQRIES